MASRRGCTGQEREDNRTDGNRTYLTYKTYWNRTYLTYKTYYIGPIGHIGPIPIGPIGPISRGVISLLCLYAHKLITLDNVSREVVAVDATSI